MENEEQTAASRVRSHPMNPLVIGSVLAAVLASADGVPGELIMACC